MAVRTRIDDTVQELMKDALKTNVRGIALPIGRGLSKIGLTANGVTFIGLIFAFVSAWGFWQSDRVLAFGGLLLSGLADLLDGAVARAQGGAGTKFGAAFDSTLDRYGEGIVFGGIVLGLIERFADTWLIALAVVAATGSFLVSYVRARAEGLGVSCEVGFLERPERIVLLLILAAWGAGGSLYILAILAVLSHVTFIHRLVHVWRNTQGEAGRL